MSVGMQGKIVLLYSLLILFAMQVSGVYLVNSLEDFYLRNYSSQQLSQAELMGSFMRRYLAEGEEQKEYISSLITEFGGGTPDTETIVLDRYGRLLGGAEQSYLSLPRERVIQDDILLALAGNTVEAIRVEPETGMRNYFLALPVKDGSAVEGVIFVRGSLEDIYLKLHEIKMMLITGWSIVLGIAIVVSFMLTRTITRPIREVTSRAAAMADGDFSQLIEVRSEDEIGELGGMFNFLTSQLQDTLSAISGEKNKVEAILNYMTDGIIAFNNEKKVIHLNPAAETVLSWVGVSPGEGMSGEMILGNFFDREELEKLLSSREPTTREVHLKEPYEKTLQIHFAPFEEKERQKGMLVVLHDFTRERAYARMQEEFAANVSHELRTPLTTIKNYVETLLNGAQDNVEVRERFLHVVDNETERMVKLIKDLLILSQIDYQEARWLKENIDISVVVEEVIEQVEMESKAKEIDLAVKIPHERITVYLDKDKIRQVLLNLLSNALKFTPYGGKIEIKTFQKDGYVHISVCDNGVGIPIDEKERVFDRFYRVDKTRSRDSGGTGLGLSIAKQIVEAHGGSIFLESKPGEGTEVTFSLPLFISRDDESLATYSYIEVPP